MTDTAHTYLDKIVSSPEALVPKLDQLREAGGTIVFGNGCFDILHVGHVRYMMAARALGDVLVIAVNTEASIALNEGREPSINPYQERMEMIAALSCVDYVVPLEEATPVALLRLYRPHIQAKGTDYTLETMPEREVVESLGGRLEFVGDEKTHSSTTLRAHMEARGDVKR